MINVKKIMGLAYFTSEIDLFLAEFDSTHPRLSKSQRLEKEKFERIFKMRDDPNYSEQRDDFWDKF